MEPKLDLWKEAFRKLGAILQAHKEGKPIMREIADRIIARERSREIR